MTADLSTRRVLDAEPHTSLASFAAIGGGTGIEAAAELGPDATVDRIEASGLRGRGGAGFPTGRKWRTIRENASDRLAATVVVNAAEGEPGSFKDRAILRANPYRVLEGALVAARTVGADAVVVALKASFGPELARVRAAIEEVRAAGWAAGVELMVVEGPSHYLYGEETGLMEVLAGRNPFPRLAPPFRHGLDELGPDTRSAADEPLAGPTGETAAAPTLVNNVETFANVGGIVARGPAWFRSAGTEESPGTVVCTVSGDTRRAGVAEVAMGTPLSDVIEAIGGGVAPGRQVAAVLSGVANPIVPGRLVGTAVSHEAMAAIGSGLGAAGFLVFDDATDPVAIAAGVSRFLAVESCGQCQPCKQDGLALAELLGRLCGPDARPADAAAVADHAATVADGARCYLATQQQRVVESLLHLYPGQVRAHAEAAAVAVEPVLVAPIADLSDGIVTLDTRQAAKQPDWTYGDTYSGQSPADRVNAKTGLL
ncbi:MAG: NADH-ubiquinone oxidoreductase-F iron-sulfur binding region domain-containing protein [Acidimicrobiales bacterium]